MAPTPYERPRSVRNATASNDFKAALTAGDRSLIGLWIASGDPYVASIAGSAGFDWLLIDSEHGPNDLRSILGQLMALQASASALVVRPPTGEPWILKQLLDVGAQNLLVPMVDTPDQAKQLVRAVRYPPRGIRGMGAAIARASDFGRDGGYAARADENVCLLVQAESRTALANVRHIAEVEGVDGVFIGPADLAADLGRPVASDEVQRVIEAGIASILAAGKPAGILTFDATLNQRYLDLGATFVAVGADVTEYATALDALAARYGLRPAGEPRGTSY
ncbi:MAG: HpcH/HpaI aldolase/citrate lyase family protein [Propioniciclava sp.]